MEFSMIFEAQIAGPTAESERRVMHECVEQAVLAEEMGFDRIWAVEHHCLHQYAHMSAPEVFLSFVAGKTSRIRIAHGVACLPFKYNHPIRVAERTAMLDILSEGRLDVGVGKGATDEELLAFGIDKDRALDEVLESLSMLPRMWQDEIFEHNSDLIQVPPRRIIPKPVQDPHPPLFMACTREAMFTYSGEHGIGALALGFAGPGRHRDEERGLPDGNREPERRRRDRRDCERQVRRPLPRNRARRSGRGAAPRVPRPALLRRVDRTMARRTAAVDSTRTTSTTRRHCSRCRRLRSRRSFGSEDIKSISIDEIRSIWPPALQRQPGVWQPDDAIAYIERLIEVAEPTRSCSSCRWARCRRRRSSSRSVRSGSTSSRTSRRSRDVRRG